MTLPAEREGSMAGDLEVLLDPAAELGDSLEIDV